MKAIFVLLAVFGAAHAWGSERLLIGPFSQATLAQWQAKSFVGKTDYALVEMDGRRVLRAHSRAAASGLFYRKHIDLEKTPYLNWSWRVDKIQDGLDERSKGGDDYPVRLYVVFATGPFIWQQGALNYVWSNTQAAGSTWKSAYTSKSQMIALRGGAQRLGQWLQEKRNLKADLQHFFGEGQRRIQAIAIMTDADDSGGEYLSYYGDIYLSSD